MEKQLVAASSAFSGNRAIKLRLSTIMIAFAFFLGTMLNMLAYGTREPFVVALVFLVAGMTILYMPGTGGHYERKIFFTSFSICWFMAGIAAIYANYLGDPFQNYSDASWFFELSVSENVPHTLVQLRAMTEGSLAVFVWQRVYDLFSHIGLEKGRYIGIAVNCFLVSFTGVVGIKMVRLIYGYDIARFNRFILLFSSCGMFWLFGAIYLRDAFVLLAVTLLAYFWVRCLGTMKLRNVLPLVVFNIICFVLFTFLRTEFAFVPVAMLLAASGSLFLMGKMKGRRKFVAYAFLLSCLLIMGIALPILGDHIYAALSYGATSYQSHAANSASRASLGMALIVNQSVPVRVVLGSIYLFVFPIPFWSGFQLESAYHVFKSINVIYFYFVIPLLILSVMRFYAGRYSRTPTLLFLFCLMVGFVMAIAVTSLETRHLGTFLVPILLVAISPDLRKTQEHKTYDQLLFLILSGVIGIHIVWCFLKIA